LWSGIFAFFSKGKIKFPVWSNGSLMRFVAFLATKYDEVFSGYQLGQMVEW